MVTNIEALKSQSIVSVIERYIPLRKNGTNFIACCPFHSEKSPSFVVSESKGMYKCFGCGKGGDAISFIKEYEKIDFNEALQRLSELTNIALEYDKAQRVGKSPSEVLEKINALAKAELQKHREIIEYLAARGITQEICQKYDIGLVPSKEILLANFSAGELVESGFANNYGSPRGASTARDDRESNNSNHAQNLNTPQDSRRNEQRDNSTPARRRQDFEARIGVLQGERGDKTDGLSHKRAEAIHDSSPKANAQNIAIPMHHRIGIAIRNPQHKIVAFVARTHPHYNFNKTAPKYINSKESYFYKKAQILYLYSNAKATIQAQKAAFVVEGYIDSILLHENGYKHAIATGGTAFNIQHLNLLTRLDCEVIFCFDNDKSGMAANFRAVKVCFQAGFYRVRVALLKNKDSKGRLCKDINEALLAMDRHADKSARDDNPQPSLRGSEATQAFHKAQKVDSSTKSGSPRGANTARDDRERESKAESTREKLEFNFLSGFDFFIKWLYKNKDKTSAFNEIKAAIAACKNFYDKQAFLESACKLTGVPQEYFTQDRLPTKQANDDYNTLIASILHSEECAYIASELDLSFLPKELEKIISGALSFGLESAIAAPSLCDRHPSLISAHGLQSPDSSSKILPREKTEAKQQNIPNEIIEATPLDSNEFYQHYCDLYLAHLHREQTKARAKKDLHLVLALSEKIAQVKQDIHAQKAF